VKAGLGTYFEQFPQLSVSPKRVIAEGDLVAVHSHYVDTPGERGQAVLELGRRVRRTAPQAGLHKIYIRRVAASAFQKG
jgi:predicted SnoaL-like aldol condensation-catalyzing enzyme